jgi:nicotinate-nucleotide adenylyltransferase
MKTLCLGGSFNPIHYGHLICARAVAESAGFARVLLIPSGRPPHKPGSLDIADGSDRLHMCRLAIKPSGGEPAGVQFDVSDIELLRQGPSFTIDTVRALKNSGWLAVHWLIGADMLNFLPKWHEPAALLGEAEFIVMARPGVPIDWSNLPSDFSKLKNNLVIAPLIEISSSDIRNRIRAGRSIDYLTPPKVVDYIREKRLYRD